jgi:RNA polymerase sigma-70 factor (ECF subfamily)
LPRDPGRATEVLYRRHGATVFRYAWHLLGRREDAEDATQATFLAAHAALTSGTAVLEPAAWVIRIARNECMGRLRRKRPAAEVLGDDVASGTAESVESAAEVRDEMRIARRTLSLLPEQQREAFVLREWLGLRTTEVALALGVTPTGVDDLTAQARRSLVLALGGLEPAIGCAATRTSLEAGTLDRAGKVHLLRCPVCRGVRRALSPHALVGTPTPAVAARLAGMLPGFGAGGGGIIAALTAKAATAPVVAKTAALVAATLLTGGAVGEAIRTSHPAHVRSAGPPAGRGGPSALAGAAGGGARRASLVLVTPAAARDSTGAPAAAALASSTVLHTSASRGGAALGSDDSGGGHDSAGDKGSPDRRDGHGREDAAGRGSRDDNAGAPQSGRSQSRDSSHSGDDAGASRDGSATTDHAKTSAHARGDAASTGAGAGSDGGGQRTASDGHGGGDDGSPATTSSWHGGDDSPPTASGGTPRTDAGGPPAAAESVAPSSPADASGAPAATSAD